MIVSDKEIQIEGSLVRIGRLSLDKCDTVDDPATMINALGHCGSRIDIFTFLEKLPPMAPPYPYRTETDNLAALPLTTYDHWWTKQLSNKTRNMVRTAEKKGIVVREVGFDDELVRGISNVYNESPIRQGKPFWHYGKDLPTVRRMNSTFFERSVYIGAFLGENMVGFARLIFDAQRTRAGLIQIISMVSHRDKAPTNALIAQAVRSCTDRNIPYLVYSSFGSGSDSLSDFKMRNGFERVNLLRYYVPLTLAGRAALQLGLHHRLSDRIPEPLATKLKAWRSQWAIRQAAQAHQPITTEKAAQQS